MNNPEVLTFLNFFLFQYDGSMRELAPGMMVYYQEKKTRHASTEFFVAWDPKRWLLGKENPKLCVLQISFPFSLGEPLPKSAIQTGRDLLGHLENTFTPLEEGVEFYPNSTSNFLKLISVEVKKPDPLAMS